MVEKARLKVENSNFMNKVVGQGKVKLLLQRLWQKNRLPHALLFYGLEGSGKEAAGLELGKALLCSGTNQPCGVCHSCRVFAKFQHPDFYYLFPIKRPKKLDVKKKDEWQEVMNDDEIKEYRKQLESKAKDYYYHIDYEGASDVLISQVRYLIRQSHMSSYHGGRRFVLISSAHKLNKEAQNSLLKLLEEPPADFYLCLVTDKVESLLPTTVSRCQLVYFQPLSSEEIYDALVNKYGIDSEAAEKAAIRANGSFSQALDIIQSKDEFRKQALDVFLMGIVRHSYIELFQLLRSYNSPKKYSKSDLKRILLNIDQWLRDIMLMEEGEEPYYHKDLEDRLQKFRNNINYTYNGLGKLREAIKEAVELFEKNLYIDLILTNLCNMFTNEISWKK